MTNQNKQVIGHVLEFQASLPFYEGYLRNDSYSNVKLKDGKSIWFHSNHCFK